MPAAADRRSRWPEIALLALTFWVYLNAFGNDFLWDDVVLIVNNPAIKHWQTVPSLFAGDILPGPEGRGQSNYFRPLQMLTYAFDYQIWGLDPFGFHLTSTLLHALAAVLLFALGRRLLGGDAPALAAAALWAVHPVHTEAVTYVSGRSDPLAGVLLLASLLAFARARAAAGGAAPERRFPRWSALSLGCFFLALLAREAALAWLLLVPLVDAALDRAAAGGTRDESPRTAWRQRLLSRYAPYLAVAAAYLGLRALASDLAPIAGGTAQVPLGLRLATMLEVVVRYLAFLLLPADPHMERRIEPAGSLAEPAVLGSALVVGAILYLAWGWRRGAWPAAFGVAWFFLALAAVANVLPLATFMAEHWLYVPSMGVALAAGWGAGRLAERWRQPVATALVVLVAAYGLATALRNRDWRDARTLFEATVASATWSAKAWSNLGNAYLELGETDKARPALERAIELAGGAAPVARLDLAILHRQEVRPEAALEELRALAAADPGNALARNEIALTLADLGRPEEAGQAFAAALKLDPTVAAIHSNYGNWYFRRGELDQALERYRAAIELDPDYAEAYNNLGSVELRLGRPERAAAAYRQALELDPDLAQARRNLEIAERARTHRDLGIAERRDGRPESALERFRSAAAADPGDALAWIEIAVTEAAQGRDEAARQAYERALELGPRIAVVHNNYGNWLFRRGELDQALERYEEALRLDPDYADAYNNLGSVRFRRGEYKLAVAAYRKALELDPGLETARENIEVVRARVLSERAE